MQKDINQVVSSIQGTVSDVLTLSTNETLTKFENLKNKIKDLEEPLRLKIAELDKTTECYALNDINFKHATNASVGYQTSICASAYDNLVQTEIEQAQQAISNNSDFSFGIQQIVVRSFLSVNAYMHAAEIQESMQQKLKEGKEDFDASKPKNNKIVENFQFAIKAANAQLAQCHTKLLESVTPMYTGVAAGIESCKKFEEDKKSGASFDEPELPQEMVDFVQQFPVFSFNWQPNSQSEQ